ncbi:MAG: hypothetical protein M3P27_12460 [Acidobacteriota bacterium]|nr:hypothetical protein [Acidobacteriota bacterium]
MTMEPGEFKLTFRIEQLPDGTFVGRSDNPKLEITGATPQEVQQKIQHSMGARFVERLGIHLTTNVTGSGVEVTATKNTPGAADAPAAGSSAPAVFSSHVSSANVFSSPQSEVSGTEPITAEPIDAGSLRAQRLLGTLLGLAIALGMLWWFFHR